MSNQAMRPGPTSAGSGFWVAAGSDPLTKARTMLVVRIAWRIVTFLTIVLARVVCPTLWPARLRTERQVPPGCLALLQPPEPHQAGDSEEHDPGQVAPPGPNECQHATECERDGDDPCLGLPRTIWRRGQKIINRPANPIHATLVRCQRNAAFAA